MNSSTVLQNQTEIIRTNIEMPRFNCTRVKLSTLWHKTIKNKANQNWRKERKKYIRNWRWICRAKTINVNWDTEQSVCVHKMNIHCMCMFEHWKMKCIESERTTTSHTKQNQNKTKSLQKVYTCTSPTDRAHLIIISYRIGSQAATAAIVVARVFVYRAHIPSNLYTTWKWKEIKKKQTNTCFAPFSRFFLRCCCCCWWHLRQCVCFICFYYHCTLIFSLFARCCSLSFSVSVFYACDSVATSAVVVPFRFRFLLNGQ